MYLAMHMIQLGHKASVLVKYCEPGYPDFIHSYYGNRLSRWVRILDSCCIRIRRLFLFKKIDPLYALQTLIQFVPLISPKAVLRKISYIPDVIVVFFMQRFVNYIDIYHLQKKTNAPVFIIFPDMANFTGLCHFSYKCARYRNHCGRCPAVRSQFEYDISFFNHSSKTYNIKRMNVTALYWAKEIGTCLEVSSMFKNKKLRRIPLTTILEDSYYYPNEQEKTELRREMEIGDDELVLGICSVDLRSHRKGIPDIVNAVNILTKALLPNKRVVCRVTKTGAKYGTGLGRQLRG